MLATPKHRCLIQRLIMKHPYELTKISHTHSANLITVKSKLLDNITVRCSIRKVYWIFYVPQEIQLLSDGVTPIKVRKLRRFSTSNYLLAFHQYTILNQCSRNFAENLSTYFHILNFELVKIIVPNYKKLHAIPQVDRQRYYM